MKSIRLDDQLVYCKALRKDPGRLIESPLHPYTQAFLSSAPVADPGVRRKRIRLTGGLPSPIKPCPEVQNLFRRVAPPGGEGVGAPGVWVLVVTVANLTQGENLAVELAFSGLRAAAGIFILMRFGLVALAGTAVFSYLLVRLPVTLDFSAWYAGRSVLLLTVLFAVAAYGFRTALAGQPMLSAARPGGLKPPRDTIPAS